MSAQRLYWYKCVRLSRLLAFECTLNHCTFISCGLIHTVSQNLKFINYVCTAAHAWNSLITSVTRATSLAPFKRQLKTFLFTKSMFVYRALEALLLMSR